MKENADKKMRSSISYQSVKRIYFFVAVLTLVACAVYKLVYVYSLRQISAADYTISFKLINSVLVNPVLYGSFFAIAAFFICKSVSENWRKVCISAAVLLVLLYCLLVLLWLFDVSHGILAVLLKNPFVFSALGFLTALGVKR